MSNFNLYEWHRLFDRWQGQHRWQNYDSMKAVYPSFEEFEAWFETVTFRYYTVQNEINLVDLGVGHHRTISKSVNQLDLSQRSPLWFKLYDQVVESDQWTLDGTIKVMISLMKHGALARCNLRMNGRHSINKGAKLAWACWLLNKPCPLVVAMPQYEIPEWLSKHKFKTISKISELETVYPEPSRAVLLPRTWGEGPHNIDAWTLHENWNTYLDEAHTQFPLLDWDKWFDMLWTWARPYSPDVVSVWHKESNQLRLFPIFEASFEEWQAFWMRCSRENLLIDR